MSKKIQKYVPVFSFQVLDRIADGHEVYVLDKGTCECVSVRDIFVGDFVKMLNSEDQDRFEYWYSTFSEVTESESV